jgi:sulfate adenylyltransferase subunit 2/3'(2'), 5'-bisphosphate nucleotidase
MMIETPILELALLAGQEIMKVYNDGFTVSQKNDRSPVTEADERAEAVILKGLKKLTPDIAIIAEESVAAGNIPEIGARFYLVDPLDGTKEFISKNGEFTVNIALIEDAAPVFGVVYAPALKMIYWGGKNSGAYAAEVTDNIIGTPRELKVRTKPQDGLIAIGSRSHAGPETLAYLETFNIREFVAAGSSLKFCLIAEGKADLYPRMGRTMEWDTAAGDAVLRAAGGRVETIDGRDLTYGKREQPDDSDFANPHFIAFGDHKITTI